MDTYRRILCQAYRQALNLADQHDCSIMRDQASMLHTLAQRIADKQPKAYFWLGDDA
jgi:hypothetical protein